MRHFHAQSTTLSDNASVAGPYAGGGFGGIGTPTWHLPNNHQAGWDFYAESSVTVTTKSMTEMGPLTAFIDMRAATGGQTGPYSGCYRPGRRLGKRRQICAVGQLWQH